MAKKKRVSKPRNASSYSLTEEVRELLEQLADHLGLSMSAVLQLAIRQLAKKELKSKGTS